ncbi:pentapeptide repeat-containing protein [Cellulomonas taurus]|uniref:pentapeptide repeat-containing protein n=1 Tax=Cellulomonas taurus TaxID=2729175 RepID=UPI00145D3251|nr:pentapeptide repeat-containing protein [Cellulomonas taurus]
MTAGLAVAVAIIATIVVAVAVGIFVFVTTPEVAGRAASRSSQAVQAASVCAAVIGGAITLWLSNIRRDHDRSQLAMERRRLDDQRFGQAVSMLKEEGDAARIGAIEMLRDLATLEPDRTQAVLDILGAVIRIPAVVRTRTRVARPRARNRDDIVQEAALRAMRRLLPPADDAGDTVYTVDLSGADVEDLDFRGVRLRIRANGTRFHGAVTLVGATIESDSSFSDATFYKAAWFDEARFVDRSWFARTAFEGVASFNGTTWGRELRFDDARCHGDLKMAGMRNLGQPVVAQLSGLNVGGDLVMKDSRVFGAITLGGASIAGVVDLSSVQVVGGVQLAGATCGKDVVLDHAEIGATVKASGASVGGTVSLCDAVLSAVSLTDTRSGPSMVDRSRARMTGRLHMRPGVSLKGELAQDSGERVRG